MTKPLGDTDISSAGGVSSYAPAVIGAITSVYNNQQNIKAQKEMNASNQEFQKEVNAENMDFQREQFNYQRHLNENQYQITMSDMQKAGLNPMLANGVSLSAGNYNSTSQATRGEAPQSDLSPLISLIQQAVSLSSAEKVARADRESAEKIASEKNKSEEKIAEENRKTQELIAANQISAENMRLTRELAYQKDKDSQNRLLERELRSRGMDIEESKIKAEQIQKQLDRDQDYQLALKKLDQEEQAIKNAKDANERMAHEQSKRTWLIFISNIVGTVVNAASNFVGVGGSSSNPIGFTAN